jgi:hypothetical protein
VRPALDVLSDAQIERYSRQIIVPRIGGRGQEHLMAARLTLAGDARDIEAPLAYLVGAGVSSIELYVAGPVPGVAEGLATNMRALNPDTVVVPVDASLKAQISLALIIVGSGDARTLALKLAGDPRIGAVVIARLDSPGMIAVLPRRSPCARCADPKLLADFGARIETADFISIVATSEAFKLAAGYTENPALALLRFSGYESVASVILPVPGCSCSLSARRS